VVTGDPDPRVTLPAGIPTGIPAGYLCGPAPVLSLRYMGVSIASQRYHKELLRVSGVSVLLRYETQGPSGIEMGFSA
jgi:hypothetical protein